MWTHCLAQTLHRLSEKRPLRLAVLGVGQELRGDDGAGLAVARGLRPFAHKQLLVIEAGHAPENVTALVRRFAPTLVLLVDAAQMDEPPGTVCWLAPSDITGVSASSHTLPLHLLARFLQLDVGCEVALLGIQPADTSLGAPLSAGVETAVSAVIAALGGAALVDNGSTQGNEPKAAKHDEQSAPK